MGTPRRVGVGGRCSEALHAGLRESTYWSLMGTSLPCKRGIAQEGDDDGVSDFGASLEGAD